MAKPFIDHFGNLCLARSYHRGLEREVAVLAGVERVNNGYDVTPIAILVDEKMLGDLVDPQELLNG